jgi:2-C-methyl-D-erythritol 2,4-cyclodiphosphate synthase
MTIVAQAPKMAKHIPVMRDNIAAHLQTTVANINVKATTTEKLGPMGREEGIAAHAVVLLK